MWKGKGTLEKQKLLLIMNNQLNVRSDSSTEKEEMRVKKRPSRIRTNLRLASQTTPF